MMKENWERKLFYLLTPALMGDPFSRSPMCPKAHGISYWRIMSRTPVLLIPGKRSVTFAGACRIDWDNSPCPFPQRR
jgi:hypothetical protein